MANTNTHFKEEYDIYHREGWGYKVKVGDGEVEIFSYDEDFPREQFQFKFSRELIRPILLALSRMQGSMSEHGDVRTTKTITVEAAAEKVVVAPWSEDPETIELQFYENLDSSKHSAINLGCNMDRAFIDLFQQIAV